MAWPDFSELTFAFAFLREFEEHFGPYAVPPDFISQAEEYTKGYDAEVNLGGALVFIQFKRSEVMSRSSAKEVKYRDFPSLPVYRMHLHRKNRYGQHLALQALEADGFSVFYMTSAVRDRNELNRHAQRKVLVGRSGWFTPSEIVLPDRSSDHHVSFCGANAEFKIYSERPTPARRRIVGIDALRPFLQERQREPGENLLILKKFVDANSTPATDARLAGVGDIRARAAAVALLRYDLSLLIAKA